MTALSLRNPAQMLDFRRFSSDELLGHYEAEAAVLRQRSTIPVTTNFMVTTHQSEQDYFAWAPECDVVSQDHYLDHRLPHPHAEQAFTDDLTRGLARGSWLLMESATSAVNWQPVNVAKRPFGLVRLLGPMAGEVVPSWIKRAREGRAKPTPLYFIGAHRRAL